MTKEIQKEMEELIEKNERRRILIDLLKQDKENYSYEEIEKIVRSPENN